MAWGDLSQRTALHEKISAAGARTVLFMTWGYVLGDRWHEPHDTYAAMQARLADGYSKLGRDLGVQVAPAGLAWAEALRREPSLDLWEDDGKHPGRLGSYLGACVFYALPLDETPLGAVSRLGSSPGTLVFFARWQGRSATSTCRTGLPKSRSSASPDAC